MPNYEVPVDLTLYVKADSEAHCYGIVQIWFNALQSGEFEKFLSMRRDGTIFPSSYGVNEEDIKDLLVERIQNQQTQRQLDEQRQGWKTDEAGRRLIEEE